MINTHPHSASESARLIQELKTEISRDQATIRLEDPRLKRLEQEIASERAALERKELQAGQAKEHLQHIKDDLTKTENQFRELQKGIQAMGLERN